MYACMCITNWYIVVLTVDTSTNPNKLENLIYIVKNKQIEFVIEEPYHTLISLSRFHLLYCLFAERCIHEGQRSRNKSIVFKMCVYTFWH